MSGGPVKVCHIITMLELGGAQQNTLYTVTHLDRSRFEPILVTGTEGELVADAAASGVAARFLPSLVRPISPARDLSALADLTRFLLREGPDVVHTHSSKAGILGRLAAAQAGVPVIVHSIHGWGFHPRQNAAARALYVSLERIAARPTHAFIGVSQANLSQGIDLGIVPRAKARLIRSGIRLDEFRPAGDGAASAPLPFERSGPGPVIGMVACFKPQKAPLDFLRVASEVAASEPEARFAIAGDGELRPRMEAMIRERGLEGRIALLGWRRDVAELMRSFDILLHTSHWEGLPRVFPEAMATGLPIVATRVDGAPEAIEEGVSGFLFEPGDVPGMAGAVVELIRDPARRRAMGMAGLARAGEWDIDRMVRAQEDLYASLLVDSDSGTRRSRRVPLARRRAGAP